MKDSFIYVGTAAIVAGTIKAYNHAMRHVTCRDFEKTDVQRIEISAKGADTGKMKNQ